VTAIPNDFYRRNLSALHVLCPEAAARIDAEVIPSTVLATTGRDGQPHFLIQDAQGKRAWFGGSSMPGVSAPERFAGFVGDGRNVALPGVMTGMESVFLLSRMPAHAALFVLETNPLHVKLALHLRDLTQAIEAGRWVPLMGTHDEIEQQLVSFIEGNPGYERPFHLLTSPTVTNSRIAGWTRVLETAGRRIVDHQAALASRLCRNLRAERRGPLGERPSVVVLGVDARPGALEQAGRIARALNKLAWRHEVCVPDSPSRCHSVARLRAIEVSQADVVIWLNGAPGSLRAHLPRGIGVVSWYAPDADVPASARDAVPPGDLVVAGTAAQREAAVAAGVPADAILLTTPAADDVLFHPIETAKAGPTSYDAEAVLLADLPDDRPSTAGVTMLSHVRLWRAAQRIARRETAQGRAPAAEVLLRRAESDSKVALRDADLRRKFEKLLDVLVLPAAWGRACRDALGEAGIPIATFGRNWSDEEGKNAADRGPIPRGEALNRLFNTVGVVILPFCSPHDLQTALDATASGATVVCRNPPSSDSTSSARKERPFGRIPTFSNPGELVRRVRALRADGSKNAAEKGLRDWVLGEHTVTVRLRRMVEALRRSTVMASS